MVTFKFVPTPDPTQEDVRCARPVVQDSSGFANGATQRPLSDHSARSLVLVLTPGVRDPKPHGMKLFKTIFLYNPVVFRIHLALFNVLYLFHVVQKLPVRLGAAYALHVTDILSAPQKTFTVKRLRCI